MKVLNKQISGPVSAGNRTLLLKINNIKNNKLVTPSVTFGTINPLVHLKAKLHTVLLELNATQSACKYQAKIM